MSECLNCGKTTRWTALFCSGECKDKYNNRKTTKKYRYALYFCLAAWAVSLCYLFFCFSASVNCLK
jgi:predicted nucleic acid-binding Zn ribbon protein